MNDVKATIGTARNTDVGIVTVETVGISMKTSVGCIPHGTIELEGNGEFDVAGYKTAVVFGSGGERYDGEYEIKPTFEAQILPTKAKVLTDDITVNAIEVSRTTNLSGGKTVYIGGLING